MLAGFAVCAAVPFLMIGCTKPAEKSGTDTTAMSSSSSAYTAEEQQNIDVSKQFEEEVFNKGNLAFAEQHIDSNYTEHMPMPEYQSNIAGFKKMVTDMRAAMPDVHMTVENILAKGDMVAIMSH